jgi:hypothetical protein
MEWDKKIPLGRQRHRGHSVLFFIGSGDDDPKKGYISKS